VRVAIILGGEILPPVRGLRCLVIARFRNIWLAKSVAILESQSRRSHNMVFTPGLRHTFHVWRRGLALVQFLVAQTRSLRSGRCRKNLPLSALELKNAQIRHDSICRHRDHLCRLFQHRAHQSNLSCSPFRLRIHTSGRTLRLSIVKFIGILVHRKGSRLLW
jgi:hypothetical protein